VVTYWGNISRVWFIHVTIGLCCPIKVLPLLLFCLIWFFGADFVLRPPSTTVGMVLKNQDCFTYFLLECVYFCLIVCNQLRSVYDLQRTALLCDYNFGLFTCIHFPKLSGSRNTCMAYKSQTWQASQDFALRKTNRDKHYLSFAFRVNGWTLATLTCENIIPGTSRASVAINLWEMFW